MKKLIKINLKQKFALMACVTLLFVLCRPLLQLMEYENVKRYADLATLIESMEAFFLPSVFTDCIPTLASSGIIALVFFSYLFSKKRVDLYHSIPVDRKKLFIVNYISGVIVYMAALFIEFIICVLVAVPNHYMTGTAFMNMLAAMVVNTVHFLFGYSITIFTIMLTGNIIVAVLGSVTISLFYPVLVSLLQFFTSSMYVTFTNCNAVKEDLLTKYYWFSPVTSYATIIERLSNRWDIKSYAVARAGIADIAGISPYTKVSLVYPALIMPFVMVVLFTACAYFLYMIRPSEAAGKTIAFKKSQPFIRIPIVILGGFIGAWFILISVNGFRTNWMWLGVAIGVILSHCVLEIIFRESFRALFSDKIQLVFSIAVTVVVMGIFHGDLTGYDKYIPNRENIESAAVYFEGIDNNLSCMTVREDPDNPGCYIADYNGFMNYTFTRPFEDGVLIDKIYALSQIGTSCVDDMLAARFETGDDSIMYAEANTYGWATEEKIYTAEDKEVELDISDEEAYKQAMQWMKENGITEQEHGTTDRKITIDICFTLKNGHTVLRHYDIPLSKALHAINEVYKTEEFNRNHFDIYDAYEYGALGKTDVYDVFESRVITFTEEDSDKFLEIYFDELSKVTIDEISELPIGRIAPSFKTSYGYDETMGGYYIYPSFTKTLDYLKSKGADTENFTTEIPFDKIQNIFVSSYNLYKYENGDTLYLGELIYNMEDNADEIKELVPHMINSSNLWSNEILINNSEDGLGADVSVTFTADKGMQRQAAVMFTDGKLPDKIKKDIAVGIWKENNY